ncbi:hypothetical protein SAMN04488498_107154 [Mesorhizobium albiziae]|uniref:Uncharacterized protein n=1 Tax=Neomesorhizobium albiziae TaxID=335020 RepID=A0A1I4A5I8_9HYPH|nr:hypothetical protein [Mesorhizobium albiziae]GLS34047.1 hypothetical protein GCM10007937_57600 [Mesorhizobium albiziae]SFK51470.1 hypothetical protein SAMN04488498_107154 [Mesorhizobium albiziae]
MSDFEDIFADVVRIVTFQPREARMRYRPPEWDERLQAPERKNAHDRRRTDRSLD